MRDILPVTAVLSYTDETDFAVKLIKKKGETTYECKILYLPPLR